MQVRLITAIIDWERYEKFVFSRFISEAPHYSFSDILNKSKNEPIPVVYNREIESLLSKPNSDDMWFAFIHEDFEITDDLYGILAKLPKDYIYGAIGAITEPRLCGIYQKRRFFGEIMQNDEVVGNRIKEPFEVDTFDCCSLFVHSSVLRKHPDLRFDPNCKYDLYVEDFCIQAKERHGIKSYAVQIDSNHRCKKANGLPARYFPTEKYVNSKWKDVCYTGTCSFVLGGNPPFARKMNHLAHRLVISKVYPLLNGKF